MSDTRRPHRVGALAIVATTLVAAAAATGCGGNPEVAVRGAATADDIARLFPRLAEQQGYGAAALEESRGTILAGIPGAAREAPTLAQRVQTVFRDEGVVEGIRSVSADVVCGGLSTIVDEQRFPSREEWVSHMADGLLGLVVDDEALSWIASSMGAALWYEASQSLDMDGDYMIEIPDVENARIQLGCSDAVSW